MEELEVKSMLADERIPTQYKQGGRLSSEFLDGVDYAEQRIMEKGVEVWLAKDSDGWLGIFNDKPIKVGINGNFNGDFEWKRKEGNPCGIHSRCDFLDFPELTCENSPVKARIILED